MGTRITEPPVSFAQYTHDASTATPKGQLNPEARTTGCAGGGGPPSGASPPASEDASSHGSPSWGDPSADAGGAGPASRNGPVGAPASAWGRGAAPSAEESPVHAP